MARRCTVCDHANRREIDRLLIANEKLRNLAERYGLSEASLSRHKRSHIPRLLGRARAKKEKAHAADLATRVEEQAAEEQSLAIDTTKELVRIFQMIGKLASACDQWLTSPADPEAYDVNPRSGELMVTYHEMNGERLVKRRAPLSQLLGELKGAGIVPGIVETKHADPRMLLLQTADRIMGGLKVAIQIQDMAEFLRRLERVEAAAGASKQREAT